MSARRQHTRSLTGLGLLLLGHILSASTSEDWHFTSTNYQGRIKECSVACDKLYVTTSERMGVPLPLPHLVETVRFRIIDPPVDMFKADELIIGDFAFLFIRTKTDDSVNLNRERRSSYILDVRAKITLVGGQVTTSHTRIEIIILDVNDAPPLFSQGSYQFTVPESTDVFSTVGSVSASDADEGIHKEIYYSFRDWTDDFAVHPTTGDIYITRNLTQGILSTTHG